MISLVRPVLSLNIEVDRSCWSSLVKTYLVDGELRAVFYSGRDWTGNLYQYSIQTCLSAGSPGPSFNDLVSYLHDVSCVDRNAEDTSGRVLVTVCGPSPQ